MKNRDHRIVLPVQQVQGRQFGCLFGKPRKAARECKDSAHPAVMNDAEFHGHDRTLGKADQCRVRLQNVEAILGSFHQHMQTRHGLGDPRYPICFGHTSNGEPLPTGAAAIERICSFRKQERGIWKYFFQFARQRQQIGRSCTDTMQQNEELLCGSGFGQQLDTLKGLFSHLCSPMTCSTDVQVCRKFAVERLDRM